MPLRNVLLLALAQTLSMCGVTVFVLLGGILGTQLAPSRGLATLSISLTVIGVAVFTVPAALLMQRFGRRAGFVASAALAALAALLSAHAVATRSFWEFCVATTLIGFHGAFTQQYRFAAAESVPAERAGRAVSIVLVGGIVAGWLGPFLATRSQSWHPAGRYVGSFLLQAGLYALAAALLCFLRDAGAPPRIAARGDAGRPLRVIAAQPAFILAVTGAATAFAVMSFVMTATPLELHEVRHHGLHDTAWVIQSHVMAMYIPSLISGLLVERFGVLRVMLAGTLCLTACVVGALVSRDLVHVWAALVLLGVGWNFQFVSATVLLSRITLPAERGRTQAGNDFVVFAVQAAASLCAAPVLYAFGWTTLNLMAVPLLAATAITAVALRRAR